MSDVFDGYERQYCDLSANLSRRCSSASVVSGEEAKQQMISEVKAGLDEADILIRKMDLEARSLQPNMKAMLLAKLREYKSDLNKLRREAKRLSSPNNDQAARDDLLEAGMSDTHKASSDQRDRLMLSTDRLTDSSDRLRKSRRVALETEELGISILEDLQLQRETLLHSHQKLQEVDTVIDKSKKILTAMSRRISKNKYIAGSIIAALVLAIIIIIYYKLTY